MERREFLRSLAATTAIILFGNDNLIASARKKGTFNVQMIYNNIGKSSTLKTDWGVAVWIEYDNKALLFDTGGDPDVLMSNIAAAKLDTRRLSNIIISHNHWDHINGLAALLKKEKYRPKVFVPDADRQAVQEIVPEAKITGVTTPLQIDKNIWTTGQMAGTNIKIHEQALVIEKRDSLYIFTGCSHPGVANIVELVKKLLPGKGVALVAGGYHLLRSTAADIEVVSKKLADMKVEAVAPSHCTGEVVTLIFKKEWREKFIDLNIGDQMLIS